MLKLWLVVLLGFVASAQANHNTCYSSQGVEKLFKDTCVRNPTYFTPSGLLIPALNIPPGLLLPIHSFTGGFFGSVTVNNVTLSKDFATLSVVLTVIISCNEVQNLQVSVFVNLVVSWSTSLDGCLQATAGDLSIIFTFQSSSIDLIPGTLANVLFGACRPLLKTHFNTCFKGILSIVNENLKSGGALFYGTLLETVVTGVTVINGVISVVHEVRDAAGTLINYPNNAIALLLQAGDIWGCDFNAAQLAFLWNYVSKTYTSKWSTCLIQAHFNPDFTLGSSVTVKVSLNAAVSVNIYSNVIKISATANVVFTSGSGDTLVELTSTVVVSVNLTARGGIINLVYVGVSIGDWAVTSQHIGCTCNDILSSLTADLNIFLGIACREFVGNFGKLFPPGVPRCYQGKYISSTKCYDSQGDKENYCSVIYQEAS